MADNKISFHEDVLAPSAVLIIEFSGKNPVWILGKAVKLLRDTMKVSTVNTREDDIKWDITNPEKKSFYGFWRCNRGEDNWSKTWLKIVAQGDVNREGYGSVKIKLEGWIDTKVEFGSPISRWLWMLWNYTFYWKQRRAYVDFAKDEIYQMKAKIQEAYGIAR